MKEDFQKLYADMIGICFKVLKSIKFVLQRPVENIEDMQVTNMAAVFSVIYMRDITRCLQEYDKYTFKIEVDSIQASAYHLVKSLCMFADELQAAINNIDTEDFEQAQRDVREVLELIEKNMKAMDDSRH